jgi:uncharacterized protein (DUF2336 family)
MVRNGQSLIAELETAIQSGSREKRLETLRRITDLFLFDANRLNDQQIDVFDDVLSHLVSNIEGKALAELSAKLAPIKNAPIDVVRRLARDDDIEIAEPVLSQSARLNAKELIEIASTKSQNHLFAISGREMLDTSVTDVLLDRGDRRVVLRLAENCGAQFSGTGFSTLVKRSEQDEQLAEKVGLRTDLPLSLFRQLLLRATEAVRNRLLALAGPDSRDYIQRTLTAISEQLGQQARKEFEQELRRAYEAVLAMQRKHQLSPSTVFQFAESGKRAEVIAGIAALCSAPLELTSNMLQSGQHEALLIPCKAARLPWQTVALILRGSLLGSGISEQDVEQARTDYFKLTQNSASRVLRFWQVRRSAAGEKSSEHHAYH